MKERRDKRFERERIERGHGGNIVIAKDERKERQ
jgi:hypothetical protein